MSRSDPLKSRATAREGGDHRGAAGRLRKSDLAHPLDPRGLLRRCHDRLHRRGTTEDVALTAVRILLAKWRDEVRPGAYARFHCAPEEYRSPAGRAEAAARVEGLFAEVRDQNPGVFDAHERVGATADEVVEVMAELQPFRLFTEDDAQWDLLGAAYEQYTAREMKREGGQFFTNRLVVNLLTEMVEPGPGDTMLDPAGGTGGFPAAVWRFVRGRIRQTVRGKAARECALARLKGRVFCVDKKPRLVKLAQAAMLVAGNDHRGCVRADSLTPPESLPSEFLRKCPPGKLTLVMTNPPWAGLTGGRITDPLVLEGFDVAHRWERSDGRYLPTADLAGGGVPPEYLFVERCVRWLGPGGRLAIVLPKGILDNFEPALAVRHFLFRHCRVLAVVNCHKNTFQPYTGSRGCLILAEKKPRPDDRLDYPIFLAINRKAGQDSEGEPVYRPDEHGRPTGELDQDFDEILEAWRRHRKGKLKPSEYTFAINGTDLDGDTLRINPQFFLPSLNESLKRVMALDGNGFSVERLGDRIASRVWKGTRFKREDLETDQRGPKTVAYYTPTGVFSREGIKWLDLSRCDKRRRDEIREHAAAEGEILITRSGTVGRVALVGRSLAGVILSDDLVRVWIGDPHLRAFVFAFLRSAAGQDQLRRNEYGTVQQHLEPSHVADLQVPVPDDPGKLKRLAEAVLRAHDARERFLENEGKAGEELRGLLGW